MLLPALFLVVSLAAAPTCSVHRNTRGRIARDRSKVALFKATHPCPANGKRKGACPGYVVDHFCPLACCGADAPSNMQWQTRAEAKAKDAWERDCSTCH
jgi:hypothetical protein